MRHFCTYFDAHYLPRGLVLYRSLRERGIDFALWVLCMDDAAREALTRLALPGVRAISLEEFEAGDPALAAAKESRSRIEYYFTCSPSLPAWVLARAPEAELVTYVDADLCFFADPAPLFAEMGDASIAIIGHRFPPPLRDLERFGIYNVGWLSFRRDARAAECLRWWRERCLEWCFDREEGGRFADQKYLDDWPARFAGVRVLAHPGANVAPWNLLGRDIRFEGGALTADGAPLIFFHFHGLKRLRPWLYDAGVAKYRTPLDRTVRRLVYGPYVRALESATRDVAAALPASPLPGGIRDVAVAAADPLGGNPARRLLRIAKNVLARRYVVLVNGSAL